VKLVHLVGFVTKKFVEMQHGHMNVKERVQSALPGTKTPLNLAVGVWGAARRTCVVVWTRVIYIYIYDV
jgi:hypothetical protein